MGVTFAGNEKWVVVGPHWPFAIVSMIVLTALANVILLGVATEFKTAGIYWITLFSSFYLLFTLCNCVFKDPGIIRESVPVEDGSTFYCEDCELHVPDTSLHCYDCDVCIDDYDHHCPWTSKCIGSGNMDEFQGFVTFLGFYLVWCVAITIGHAVNPDW